MKKQNEKISQLSKLIVESASIVLSVVALIVSTAVAYDTQKSNVDLQRQLATQREEFEIDLKMQDAIPHLRLSNESNAYTIMNIYEPDRKLEIVDMGNGVLTKESYMVIDGFRFENIGDNIAFYNHIEYGGVAYELKELNLIVKKDEVVNFSSNNKFIYSKFSDKLTLVLRTLYGQYFSYECIINSGNKIGDTRHCTVEQIGEPILYNIENDVFKNMERHIRDINFDIDNIIM